MKGNEEQERRVPVSGENMYTIFIMVAWACITLLFRRNLYTVFVMVA